jgi:hypothetical protein
MVIEPIFEAQFRPGSYGFRPGRGGKDALRQVDRLLKAGFTFVIDADLQGYFDSIPRNRLMALVEQSISDGRVLALIDGFLRQDIMTALARWQPTAGTPQGHQEVERMQIGAERLADGALRRRLRDPVPPRSRGAGRPRPGRGVGGGQRLDAPSGQDADRRLPPARARL